MTRSILRIDGDDRIHFLQGILTQDVTRLAAEKIQFAALLSPQGKILHDMFLIDRGDHLLLDIAAEFKDVLLKRLAMYKLRAKVSISDASDAWKVSYGADGLPDPRHPQLPRRDYKTVIPAHAGISCNPAQMTGDPGIRRDDGISLGIPQLGADFAPDSIVAMDAGYDLLHAISFTKGCYVGQEITARMHYKNIARRGFYILENTATGARHLALLKFEEVEKAGGTVIVDNIPHRAHLPEWMQPKLVQFHESAKNQ